VSIDGQVDEQEQPVSASGNLRHHADITGELLLASEGGAVMGLMIILYI